MTKLILWDLDGCLLDSVGHIYEHGAKRIFAHYGVAPCPTYEEYRNQVTGDFMNALYWPWGIPRTATAEDLNKIMHDGFAEHGEPEFFADAYQPLMVFKTRGFTQVLVTGSQREKAQERLNGHYEVDRFLREIHGDVKQKVPKFQDIIARYSPSMVVGVTDTVKDAEALHAVGAKSFVVARGFDTEAKVRAAQSSIPTMRLIPNLYELLHLPEFR